MEVTTWTGLTVFFMLIVRLCILVHRSLMYLSHVLHYVDVILLIGHLRRYFANRSSVAKP